MTDELIGFILYWGVWLLVPMLIDGVTAVAYFTGAFKARRRLRGRQRSSHLDYCPLVSIVVPVYNGGHVLAACLESMRRQTYPHDRIEILVVDNKSSDDTLQVVAGEQERPFEGSIQFITLPYKGKVGALNAGIHRVNGEIICNVDADTTLHPDAIREVVLELEHDPELGAATGAIEIAPVDSGTMHPVRFITAECEFLEYYTGFNIGRQYQSETASLFTLAGAFSAFRREVLLQTFLYDQRTVSEDTSLTFSIAERFPNMRTRVISSAIAYVEPAPGLQALYAQRVRWQRGQIEVAALHQKFVRHPFRINGISLPKALIVDHTLAFPRVVWTFLMPTMYLMGYPLMLVVSATLSMYLIYMGVDLIYQLVAYSLADATSRRRLRRDWWLFLFMPAFRWTVFWFRFAGFLTALTEAQEWRARAPWLEARDGVARLSASTVMFFTQSLPRAAALLAGIVKGR
ncbi:MAG: glycosyltransferase [Chloroflexi bacterium]|nr:glycosyltransferase [Chloroflexota bacterium]